MRSAPAGGDPGVADIRWSTGDGSIGQVYVSEDGGEERLLAQGAERQPAHGPPGHHIGRELGQVSIELARVVALQPPALRGPKSRRISSSSTSSSASRWK